MAVCWVEVRRGGRVPAAGAGMVALLLVQEERELDEPTRVVAEKRKDECL
jgi:hypothetical protein